MSVEADISNEGASKTSARASLRTCLITRREAPPGELIRFVLDPQGVVAPDLRRKLPGRGVWVSMRADMVREAARKNAFARGFRKQAIVPPDLTELVETLMIKDCLQSLAMCNKAGLTIFGFAKVEAAISQGVAALLVQASDGGTDGRKKLEQAWRRASGGREPLIEDFFSSAQLDLAFGRMNVVHAVLKKGPASAAFLERSQNLRKYRENAASDVAVA